LTDDQGGHIGRMATLAAGLRVEIPAYFLDRLWGSCQGALHTAPQGLLAVDEDVGIACGVESMNRVTMASDMGTFSNNLLDRYNIVPQGFSAELIAQKWELSREELDAFSLESHQRAIRATDDGLFEREILPLTLKDSEIFKQDEGIRRDTTMD